MNYSGRVLDAIRVMTERNPAHKAEILRAVREIDYQLHVYPQFGQDLADLHPPGAKLWYGVVPPLVVHYIVVERDDPMPVRQVSVVKPMVAFSRSGIV